MSVNRKTYSKEVKFKAVIRMIKGEETIQQICSQFGIHQSVLFKWKKMFMEKGSNIFEDKRIPQTQTETGHLERKVGQLTMELDFCVP
jgi:transposase